MIDHKLTPRTENPLTNRVKSVQFSSVRFEKKQSQQQTNWLKFFIDDLPHAVPLIDCETLKKIEIVSYLFRGV